jgi:hypothetical protein
MMTADLRAYEQFGRQDFLFNEVGAGLPVIPWGCGDFGMSGVPYDMFAMGNPQPPGAHEPPKPSLRQRLAAKIAARPKPAPQGSGPQAGAPQPAPAAAPPAPPQGAPANAPVNWNAAPGNLFGPNRRDLDIIDSVITDLCDPLGGMPAYQPPPPEQPVRRGRLRTGPPKTPRDAQSQGDGAGMGMGMGMGGMPMGPGFAPGPMNIPGMPQAESNQQYDIRHDRVEAMRDGTTRVNDPHSSDGARPADIAAAAAFQASISDGQRQQEVLNQQIQQDWIQQHNWDQNR